MFPGFPVMRDVHLSGDSIPQCNEIENHGEPRFGGATVRADQQNIQWCVVGLPHGVVTSSFPTMDQLE